MEVFSGYQPLLGVEMGEKSSGINYTEKKGWLVIKEESISDKIIPIWPTHIPPGLVFFWNMNQVQPARLISLLKIKISTTIRTATFTYSWTNYQNKVYTANRVNGSSQIYFILMAPKTGKDYHKKKYAILDYILLYPQ